MLLVLYLCWIIFNGRLTIEICILGLVMTGLVYAFMCKFLSWNHKKELLVYRMALFGVGYFATLILEIIKATLATIAVSFNEKIEVEPVLVEFDVDIKSDVLKVILANSITLTPGTITVSLIGDHYKVHALDESFAVDIDKSIFTKKLREADKLLAGIEEKK